MLIDGITAKCQRHSYPTHFVICESCTVILYHNTILHGYLLPGEVVQPAGEVEVVLANIYGFVGLVDGAQAGVGEDHLLEAVAPLPAFHGAVVHVITDQTLHGISTSKS